MTGSRPISGVSNKDYGGNANIVFADSGLRGVRLANPSMQPDAKQFGTMAIAARHENAVVVEQWDDLATSVEGVLGVLASRLRRAAPRAAADGRGTRRWRSRSRSRPGRR